ncbi:hypothetical protein LHJ74_30805 [Streptomyces sp. N2-109]|uniref:Uncharacterized protein n=1 Tax=Streptomyces gossypii TaxID=2883101 RepID=A0ABT2K253_9ACTN|nr:hypothetical protein [Streptomyces gossypii]MCT2594247.1 hypothetical protein [Streptomyces gossypii]
MHLYLVSRTDHVDYYEYDAVVVRAENASAALAIVCAVETEDTYTVNSVSYSFVDMAYRGFHRDDSNADVKLIPQDGEPGVILASFNAG